MSMASVILTVNTGWASRTFTASPQLRTEITQLKVCFADFEGVKKFANIHFFSVGNAMTNYRINIGGYSGTAGDTMVGLNSRAFSTFDLDHDTYDSGNCAVTYKEAWWYIYMQPAMQAISMDITTVDSIPVLPME